MIWIALVILLVSIYVNINLFRKNEKLEDANEEFSNWTIIYSESLDNTLSKIKELDSKKMFESDDEVGGIFDSIKETVESLKEFKK